MGPFVPGVIVQPRAFVEPPPGRSEVPAYSVVKEQTPFYSMWVEQRVKLNMAKPAKPTGGLPPQGVGHGR